MDSPNPKARKQQRTVVHASDDDEDAEPAPGPSSSRRVSTARPKSKQKVALIADDEDSATPVRKAKQPAAPKTDKAPRTKQTAAAGKSRRKSAPQAKKKKAPDVDPNLPPEMDSEGDDPLLLVGTDEWVPVPWKPMYIAPDETVVKKEEDEEAQFRLLVSTESSSASSSSLLQNNSPAEQAEDDEHASPEAGPSGQSPAQPTALTEDALRQANHAFSPSLSPEPDFDTSFMSVHPEGDSSFVGMEIDEDQDVSEFTVPLRLESPPPRKRRSSSVAQRQPTPGANATPPRSQDNGNTTPPRAGLVTSPSAPSLFNGSILGQMSPGPLRLPPITPFRLKRKMVAPASPAPYPSPAFKGTRLGSLSPEKGRGPSRGILPPLREPSEAASSLNLGGTFDPGRSTSMEEDDGGEQLLSGKDQGRSAAFADSEHDALNALPATQEPEPTDDDEEAENSMQVERQLTEGLSSDQEPEMDVDTVHLPTNPSAISADPPVTNDIKDSTLR